MHLCSSGEKNGLTAEVAGALFIPVEEPGRQFGTEADDGRGSSSEEKAGSKGIDRSDRHHPQAGIRSHRHETRYPVSINCKHDLSLSDRLKMPAKIVFFSYRPKENNVFLLSNYKINKKFTSKHKDKEYRLQFQAGRRKIPIGTGFIGEGPPPIEIYRHKALSEKSRHAEIPKIRPQERPQNPPRRIK